MRVTKEIQVPATEATTKQVFSHISCDRCGEGVSEAYEHSDTEIISFAGRVNPGCDMREGWSIDCCHDCFETEVVPALINAGFEVSAKMDYEDYRDRN